ncbi:hypothetical protein NL676_028730 [Syzygium grande]|nr:hypothetical protein NL676_028730 [Syzygium grande]
MAGGDLADLRRINKKSALTIYKRRIAEAAREMLRSYQKKKESYDARVDDNDEDEDGRGGDNNDGDAASCVSWVVSMKTLSRMLKP